MIARSNIGMTDPALHSPQEASQARVIALLSDPKSYGGNAPVLRHTTHGSIVFLSGSHAYKLKRAVRFPYMDYSTPALRKAMCLRELAVNRRVAPALYEGVQAIVDKQGELAFGEVDDPGA